MKFILQIFSILLIVMMFLCQVHSNECVTCPTVSGGNDEVCGVDEVGLAKRFESECLLRYENCTKRTKYQIADDSLCQ